MTKGPRAGEFDSTLALLSEGYEFIASRSLRLGSPVFRTRLLLRPTLCLVGADAARMFYTEPRLRRAGAAPGRMQKTLLGRGGVQGLDGAEHLHRKAMFMSLMTPERIGDLAVVTRGEWAAALARWERRERVVLLPASQEVLCRAVCRWAGVPLQEDEVPRRTADLAALIDGVGGVGPRYWRGRRARARADAWAARLVERARARELAAPAGSALERIALHRDLQGRLLSPRVAGVELLNVLRPTVAISLYVTFAALALEQHPAWRETLAATLDGGGEELEWFVHEVRRFFPLFPFVAARVDEEFEWRGVRFPRGARVLLDLHGTNHDARRWGDPDAFRPERFRGARIGAFDLIPQGGGDHARGHRCPGEWITIELLKVAVEALVGRMSYRVPPQDLTVSLRRMPTMPRSRFVMTDVRRRAHAAVAGRWTAPVQPGARGA